MDPIRKNCWLLFHLSLKPMADEDELGLGPEFELRTDKITGHRTHGEAAEAAGLAVMAAGNQHLRSYIIVEASELQINLHSRAPRESDDQELCECDDPLTFGISQTCIRCGGFVPAEQDGHVHRPEPDEEDEDDPSVA